MFLIAGEPGIGKTRLDDGAHASPRDPKQRGDGGLVRGPSEIGDQLLEGLGEAGFQARGPRHGLGVYAAAAALDPSRRVTKPQDHPAHRQVSPAPRGLAIVTGRSAAARPTPRHVPARPDFDRDPVLLALNAPNLNPADTEQLLG
jgi:hypothetical protein